VEAVLSISGSRKKWAREGGGTCESPKPLGRPKGLRSRHEKWGEMARKRHLSY